jgi:hypothetical protein
MQTDVSNPPAPVNGVPQSPPGDAPGEAGQWRSRAVAAEGHLRELEAKLVEVEKQLGETRAAVDAADRRRQIERELAQADAIDLESATLLTEAAVGAMSAPDVALAVKDLKKRKPFLFRVLSAGASRASAMAGAPRGTSDDLGRAADEARTSGDRGALLRYLRLKRA